MNLKNDEVALVVSGEHQFCSLGVWLDQRSRVPISCEPSFSPCPDRRKDFWPDNVRPCSDHVGISCTWSLDEHCDRLLEENQCIWISASVDDSLEAQCINE